MERRNKLILGAVALLICLAIVACPLTWILALVGFDIAIDPLIPTQDRSREVAHIIQAQYEGKAYDVQVRQVNDIESRTDFPLNYTSRERGYRATYRIRGVPLLVRLKTGSPEQLTSKDYFIETFPSSIGVSVPEFVSILRAFARGSGQKTFEGMLNLDDGAMGGVPIVFRGKRYQTADCYALQPRTEDFGGIMGSTGEDAWVVHLDPKTHKATYLGPYEQVADFGD